MKIITLLSIIFITFSLQAQENKIPLSYDMNILLNKSINKYNNNIHTGFKPLRISKIAKINADSILYHNRKDGSFIKNRIIKRFWAKIFTDDLIILNHKILKLKINPLFNLQYGKLKNSDSIFTNNTRGIEVKGSIGDKIHFYSDFYENQTFFIPYIEEFVDKSRVAPGQGASKPFKINGHDYSSASAYLSYTPSKYFNIELGQGKHFIGNGYRSLLLSDNSFNYPYVKFMMNYKNFQYVLMYTQFRTFKGLYYSNHYRTPASFSYLSWKPAQFIELGLFEGIIWQTRDEKHTDNFNYNILNPIILANTFQYSLNNNNNSIVGLNLSLKFVNHLQFYSQFALDNIKFNKIFGKKAYFENKYAFQVGLKIFDFLFSNFKNHNIYLQTEYNYTRPYTYSHSDEFQNYSHFNQAIAHPLGSGFKEFLVLLHYSWKDFFVELKYINSIISKDYNNSNYGSDIFLLNSTANNGTDSYNNNIGQGNKTLITHKHFKIGFIINRKKNLQLLAGINFRTLNDDYSKNESNFYYLGLKTNIRNLYYDF